MELKQPKYRILCICKGNTCRTPMMEAFLKHEFQLKGIDFIEVKSAGIHPEAVSGNPANKYSVNEMTDRGLDISDHKATRVDDLKILSQYDLILFVGEEEYSMFIQFIMKDYTVSMNDFLGNGIFHFILRTNFHIVNKEQGGISNPYKKGPEVYKECAETIEVAMKVIAEKVTFAWDLI